MESSVRKEQAKSEHLETQLRSQTELVVSLQQRISEKDKRFLEEKMQKENFEEQLIELEHRNNTLQEQVFAARESSVLAAQSLELGESLQAQLESVSVELEQEKKKNEALENQLENIRENSSSNIHELQKIASLAIENVTNSSDEHTKLIQELSSYKEQTKKLSQNLEEKRKALNEADGVIHKLSTQVTMLQASANKAQASSETENLLKQQLASQKDMYENLLQKEKDMYEDLVAHSETISNELQEYQLSGQNNQLQVDEELLSVKYQLENTIHDLEIANQSLAETKSRLITTRKKFKIACLRIMNCLSINSFEH